MAKPKIRYCIYLDIIGDPPWSRHLTLKAARREAKRRWSKTRIVKVTTQEIR